MKLLSDAAEYALRAVIWLARNPDKNLTVDQIAQATRSTPGYLARVMQLLRIAGVVRSKRGVAGGFVLARDPFHLTVLEVIDAVDPVERIQRCPLGLVEHAHELCALHSRIDSAIAQIEDAFASVSIAEILNEPNRAGPLCAVTVKRNGTPL